MDNRNWLSGRFQIPAWLLILIAIGAILAPVLGITIPSFVWLLIVILLLVIGWLQARSGPSGRTVEVSDEDAPQYRLRFSNLPENVTPRLWKITDRNKLKEIKKDKDVGEVLFVAADVAFYDNNNNLVSRFDQPVKLTINYTDEDKRGLRQRTETLKQEGRNQQAMLIPVYLYSPEFRRKQRRYEPNTEKPNEEVEEPIEGQIWLPFQNFTRDDVNQTLTVEFMFWGDGQVGPGTHP